MTNIQLSDIDFSNLEKSRFDTLKDIFSLDAEKNKIQKSQKEVDKIFFNKNFTLLYSLIQKGYVLSEKQEEKLSLYISNLDLTQHNKENDLILNGTIQLSQRAYCLIYLNSPLKYEIMSYLYTKRETKFLNANNNNSFSSQGYSSKLIEHMFYALQNKPLLIKTWAQNIIQRCKTTDSFSVQCVVIDPFSFFKPYLKNHGSLQQIFDIRKIILDNKLSNSSGIDSLITQLNGLEDEYVSHHKSITKAILEENLLNTIPKSKGLQEKIVNIDESLIITKQKETVLHVPKNIELPDSSQTLLKEIDLVYKNLMNMNEHLSFEEKDKLKIIKQRIPEFTNVYLSISNKEKIDLSTNKTPVELLNQSLNEVLIYLNNTMELLDDRKMTTLKVNAHYASNYNKNRM